MTSFGYTIMNPTTGVIYQRGTIDPLAGTQDLDSANSEVTVMLPAGVKEVPSENYRYLYQQLNGQVDGNPAAVYIWDLQKKRGYINLFGISPDIFEVRLWEENGEMPVVASSIGTYLDVPEGYEKVIVVITGDVGYDEGSNTYTDGFNIYFRQYQ